MMLFYRAEPAATRRLCHREERLIKPWIFEFFPVPGGRGSTGDAPPEVAAAHFARYLELWQSAEALGFEGIFFSEHHFGPAYSPSPNLLIATLAPRTRTLRLGVMGMVVPYYQPWRLVEEIGMLDHLTGGRLEIGTSAGIPNEMAQIGLTVAEARERNDEALAIVDAALAVPAVSHHGKYWRFDNLRIVPRPLQQPSPPRWTTVVSSESARKAARRGSKICTGFHPVAQVKAIFDAYRDEAERLGNPAGPDQLALRRMVAIAPDGNAAREASRFAAGILRQILSADPRVTDRPVPDAPGPSHNFSVGEEEFIAGSSGEVAEQIVAQCRAVGAGHFLGIVNVPAPPTELMRGYELLGREVIPTLRAAS
jgi:alkanesulfonate monooxygenase SsuD/methylene tetrahydromethanopterin reductase-like flavin-dependent oxidoreductase (luciferase family)